VGQHPPNRSRNYLTTLFSEAHSELGPARPTGRLLLVFYLFGLVFLAIPPPIALLERAARTCLQAIMYLQSSRSDAGLGSLRLLNKTAGKLQEIIKVAVGIHVLPLRSLFGDGILRRSLRRVSLAKPTSAFVTC